MIFATILNACRRITNLKYTVMRDLFEYYQELPIEIQEILSKYLTGEGLSYESCFNMKRELESNGYTCDYGLDSEPYNLRKL